MGPQNFVWVQSRSKLIAKFTRADNFNGTMGKRINGYMDYY